jgi:lipoate-protein ligase A
VKFDWAVDFFIEGISDYFHVELTPKSLTEKEKETVSQIQRERYTNTDWTFGAWL